jgi:lipid A disaccharide synthetase
MEILKYYEKCSPLLYFNKNYEFFIVNRLINYKIVTLSNINYNNNIYNFYQKIEFKNTTVKK